MISEKFRIMYYILFYWDTCIALVSVMTLNLCHLVSLKLEKKFSFFVLNKQLLVLHSIYCLLLILKKSIKEGVFFPLYLSSALLNLGFLVLTAKNDPICDKLRLGVHHFNALARGALLDGNLWLFSLSLFLQCLFKTRS